MWFEGPDKRPLKWSLPIGVQFDTLVGEVNKSKELPWNIVFHYKNYPMDFMDEKESLLE